MGREADRLKKGTAAEIGGVVAAQGGYRARVQYNDGAGAQTEILGPSPL